MELWREMRQMKANLPEVIARRRVVAGIDGSPNSLLALRRAVYAARLCGACVELVRALRPDATPAAQIEGVGALAMAVRCEFPEGPGVPFRFTVECGDPGEILVKRSAGADLLVIGGPCHSAHGKFPGRDVVPYCLGRVRCPVDICAGQRAPVLPADNTRPRAMMKAGEL
jgi:nucleotide-binding universal stress UspA family protein